MLQKLNIQIREKLRSPLFTNSLWSITSNIIQNIFLSLFFIILARQYTKTDFANYVIANTIYSFLLGFSTLGLGHWFIRELINTNDRKTLLNKFFKLQLYIGLLFYFVSIIITFSLYSNPMVRSISLIMSINIIFDNIIYVVKYLNIADQRQKKSFVLLSIEAILKCLVGCSLLFQVIPMEILTTILILLRFITLNLFITYGSSNEINFFGLMKAKIEFSEFKKIVSDNWSFVVIGSLSVVNWRIGGIITSKMLTADDVANYEVSFKLLSIAYILPVIVASSIYPMLLKAMQNGLEEMKALYKKVFLPFTLFGFLAFTFVYSFADFFIPLLFGEKFADTAPYCQEMFLVMIIFPTFMLQADVLISMKLEKLDMLCNIVSIAINIGISIIGLHYFKNLSVINYAIFISLSTFHLIQDIILIRKKVTAWKDVMTFYVGAAMATFLYMYLSQVFTPIITFITFWIFVGMTSLAFFKYGNTKIKSNTKRP